MRWSTAPALALGIAALAAAGCESATPPAAESARVEAAAPGAQEVATAVVQRGSLSSAITTSGSIAARRTTTLGPSVPGRIIHIFVQAGDEVPFGAPLFQIDPGPYASVLEEAEAGLALSRAELADTKQDQARIGELARLDMISDADHTRARTRTQLAGSRVEGAQARVTRARDDLNRTLVLAPYAGSIVERGVHEGTMATVTPNTPVVVLQESGELEAVLDVPEASRVAVRRGDRVRLWAEELPDPLESEVSAVSRLIDPRTRTYRVRVAIRDPSATLKAGAFARAEITPAPRAEALLVDRAAVAQRDGAALVFRVRDGRVERVPVRLGVVSALQAEVLSGLAEGDEVVAGDAVGRLVDGARIRPLDVAARGPVAEVSEARP
jgi:RND family efflux transporter MFP subunit